MSHTRSLIAVADDCPVSKSVVPEPRAGEPTIASTAATGPDALQIERFNPNCLMGTVEALARAYHGVPNLNRLFFDYTFEYARPDCGMRRSAVPELLDLTFSRSLPLEKEPFLRRLDHYYGLRLLSKGYRDFADVRRDLETFAAAEAPVLSEIDLFHFPGHVFEGKRHEGHMMIVVGVGKEPETLRVVEAIFGRQDFPLAALRAHLDDAGARGRPFYLAAAACDAPRNAPLDPGRVLEDLDRTLANLSAEKDGVGLRSLSAFRDDFRVFHEEAARTDRRGFLIPGFWAFMCNAINDRRFLVELERDLPWVPAETVTALKERMGWLNKRWFMLDLAMYQSVREDGFAATSRMPALLDAIVSSEGRTLELIAALREGVARG